MNQNGLQKILLMGKSGVGKTSMRSMVFSNYCAKDAKMLDPTVDVDYSHVRFLGKLALSIWDCGGQKGFCADHIESKKNVIFKNANIMVYLFDIQSEETEQDINDFERCISLLRAKSPRAITFCLLHKMDLVSKEDKERVFEQRRLAINEVADGFYIPCFATSIWDESLYKTWSHIVKILVPNVAFYEENITMLAQVLNCNEVVLLEKNTYLTITRYCVDDDSTHDNLEKISYLLKYFKIACSKVGTRLKSLEFEYNDIVVIIQEFTENTFLMVTSLHSPISHEIFRLSIQEARAQLINLDRVYRDTMNLRKKYAE